MPRLERFPLNLKVAYIDHGGLGERRGPAGPGRPDVPWSGGEGGPIAGGLSLFNSVIMMMITIIVIIVINSNS